MLHAKFRENRPAGSGEEDFEWRGGHLGHVSLVIKLTLFHWSLSSPSLVIKLTFIGH